MECANCGKQLTTPSTTCPWCRVLRTNPGAGVLAPRSSRLFGYLLDIIVVGVAVFALVVIGAADPDVGLGIVLLGLLMGAVVNLYFWTQGTSIGKRLLGLTVYKATGQRAGFGTMLFRETLGKWVSGLVFSLGFLWLLWDNDHQGWHDKLVGTVVMARQR